MAIIREVTPHVGVWIETFTFILSSFPENVTPHVGVWIETVNSKATAAAWLVTPHVGVWIETYFGTGFKISSRSHLM